MNSIQSTLRHAEDQAEKTGSAADCRTAARYCRAAATAATYADKGRFYDRAAAWDSRAAAVEAC